MSFNIYQIGAGNDVHIDRAVQYMGGLFRVEYDERLMEMVRAEIRPAILRIVAADKAIDVDDLRIKVMTRLRVVMELAMDQDENLITQSIVNKKAGHRRKSGVPVSKPGKEGV